MANSTTTLPCLHSFPNTPHTHFFFFKFLFLCWIPNSLFPASNLYPNTSPSGSSRSTDIACNFIKQLQRIKAGTSHNLESNMSSSSRQPYHFHTYLITDGISFETARQSLLGQNKQHILGAKGEVTESSFPSWAASPVDKRYRLT